MIPGERALVTGGGGFLGRAVVERLLARGLRVRSFARGEYPELTALGVEVVRGDLDDREAVMRACEGCDLVFHIAAKAGLWGPSEEYHRINVVGTVNVIAACREQGTARLVFTSSPSVVFAGVDQENVNESAPYPSRFEAHYPQTKAMAEQFVIAANAAGLATVALRPHLIWGPGDPHLIPRLVERARRGQLRLIGNGSNLIDTVFIDDAAEAHLLAAERLHPGAPIAGKSYFITAGEPRPIREIINGILAAHDLPPVTRSVPAGLAVRLGGAMERVHRLFRIQREPRLTRFLALEMSTAHWFDISAARRDLGYDPRVSVDEGLRRLAASVHRSGA